MAYSETCMSLQCQTSPGLMLLSPHTHADLASQSPTWQMDAPDECDWSKPALLLNSLLNSSALGYNSAAVVVTLQIA